MRLNRSIAVSRGQNGSCEFSTLLFAHRSVTCLPEQSSSMAAALYDQSLSITISLGDPTYQIVYTGNSDIAMDGAGVKSADMNQTHEILQK